jgi:hypothetical protein
MLTIVIAVFSNAKSQDYKTGIGFRGGYSNGLTVKHFISETNALELLVAGRWGGLNITGLYEVHKPLTSPSTRWYYGGGAHLGFWNGVRNPWFRDTDQHTVVGLDGILGMEYNFVDYPFNLSLDYKPSLNFYGYFGYWGELAVSFRFLIRK